MGLLGGGFSLAGALLSGTAQGAGGLLRASGSMLLGGLASLLRAGFGQIFGVLSGLVSGAVKMAMGLPRAILSGLARLSDAVLGALGATARALSGILTGALKLGVGAFAVGIGGLVAGIAKAVQATQSWSQSIMQFRAASGVGSATAGQVQRRFGALGIDPSGMGNERAFAMRASVFGLPSYTSGGFLPSAAARYQALRSQGMVGQFQAENMAGALGLTSPEAKRALLTSPRQLREQQNFASRTQRSFGVDDRAVEKTGRDFELLTLKLKVLGQTALVAIGQRLLPILNRWADNALSIFQRFSGGASGIVDKGVSLIVKGVGMAFEALLSATRFLYVDVPAAAFKFADALLSGLATAADAVPSLFQTFLNGLDIAQNAAGMLGQTLDEGLHTALAAISGGVKRLTDFIAPLWKMMVQGTSALVVGVNAFVQAMPQISAAVLTGLSAIWNHPMVKVIRGAINKGMEEAPGIAKSVGDKAPFVLGAVHTATEPGAWLGRKAAETASGGDREWGDVGELAGRYLMGRAILSGGRALLGAGANAAAGAGTGALATAGTYLGGIVLPGILAGLGGYDQLQKRGLLPQGSTPLMEAMGNTYTRFGNLFHGRDYNAGVSQESRAEDAGSGVADLRGPSGPKSPAQVLADEMKGIAAQMKKAYNTPVDLTGSLRKEWDLGLGKARDGLGRLLQRPEHHLSWAQSLSDRYGQTVGRGGDGVRALQSQMREQFGHLADSEGRGRKFDALLAEMKEATKVQRELLQEQKRTTSATGKAATNTLARAIAYDAQDAYLVQSRVS